MRAGVLAATAVLIGALPRILLAGGALPDALRPFVWTDALHTWERGLAGGRLPYWDSFFEYPPVVGYLSAAFSLAAPNALTYVTAWALVQALSAGAIAWLLAREAGAALTRLRWCLAPQLLLLGSLNFDVLPVLALIVAVMWARRDQLVRSAAAAAVGTAAKLFPAIILPVLLLRARSGHVAIAAAFAAALLLLYAPAVLAPFSPVGGLGRYAAGIGANLDSPWGLLRALLTGMGVGAADQVVLAISLAGLGLTYLVGVLPRARHRDAAVPVALAVIALLLWSRLYSPQFSLWILPFFTLLALTSRLFALLAVADVLVFLTIFPLTLVRWDDREVLPMVLLAVLAGAVVMRHVVLIAAWREVRRLDDRQITSSA